MLPERSVLMELLAEEVRDVDIKTFATADVMKSLEHRIRRARAAGPGTDSGAI